VGPHRIGWGVLGDGRGDEKFKTHGGCTQSKWGGDAGPIRGRQMIGKTLAEGRLEEASYIQKIRQIIGKT